MPSLDEELKALSPVPSRFERLMTPANFLDEILALKRLSATHQRALARPLAPKGRLVVGRIADDPQFEAELHFGEVPEAPVDLTEPVYWTEPLVEPDPAKDYYVRLRIAQHMVNPLLQGFKTRWKLPAGWAWLDGRGEELDDEAISNPLVVTRKVRPPNPAVRAGFRVVVVARYLP